MIEMSLGTALRTTVDLGSASDEGIEYLRVRDVGWSGLSVGLAMAFLMVTCNVANDRNLQKDVSYFKTASPGDSTQSDRRGADRADPRAAVLPAGQRGRRTRRAITSARWRRRRATCRSKSTTRLEDAELAGKYKVSKDGEVVLVKGTGDKEKSQTIRARHRHGQGAQGQAPHARPRGQLRAAQARPRQAQALHDRRPRRDQRLRLGAGQNEGRGPRAPHDRVEGADPQAQLRDQAARILGPRQGRARRRDDRDDARALDSAVSRPSGTRCRATSTRAAA